MNATLLIVHTHSPPTKQRHVDITLTFKDPFVNLLPYSK